MHVVSLVVISILDIGFGRTLEINYLEQVRSSRASERHPYFGRTRLVSQKVPKAFEAKSLASFLLAFHNAASRRPHARDAPPSWRYSMSLAPSIAIQSRPALEEDPRGDDADEKRSLKIQTKPAKTEPVSETKERLLKLLPLIQSEEDHAEVARLVNALEISYSPIHTPAFLQLVMQGAWDFRYTTSQLRGDRNLRLRKVAQEVEPSAFSGTTGNMTTSITWQSDSCSGIFKVCCNYTLTDRGDLKLMVWDRILRPTEGKLDKPLELMQDLHKIIPQEVLNPDGLLLHITYMDDELRIASAIGPKSLMGKTIHVRSKSPM